MASDQSANTRMSVAIAFICVVILMRTALSTTVDTANFEESAQWAGLGAEGKPTACVRIEFASNGQMFCGAKGGLVTMYPSAGANVNDARIVWDASDIVYTWHDRGLLGMALHPNYPADPYIFVLMSVNRGEDTSDNTQIFPDSAACSSNVPRSNYCNAAARLIRIRVDTSSNRGVTDQVLISDWCAGSGSHHLGDIVFHNSEGLYVAGGDGSDFSQKDIGVPGTLCYRDDDARVQGAYRSQWDEYLHGKMLFVPMASLMQNRQLSLGGNDFRIVAKGLRNPFRFAIHPVTGDIYLGDVGSDFYEEINVIPNPQANADVPNYGWPCREGPAANPDFQGDAECASLSGLVDPFFSYRRSEQLPTERAADCAGNSVSPAGFAFREGLAWGSAWQNVLFWTESSRRCIFYFDNDGAGLPDASKLHTVAYTDADRRDTFGKWVDLKFGVNADSRNLYAVEYDSSTISKLRFLGEITIDPNIVNYEINGCELPVDDFEDSSRFDSNKNQVPGPGQNPDTCSTSQSDISSVELKNGRLSIKGSSSRSSYVSELSYGDRCFNAAALAFQFVQFEVFGNTGSLEVGLQIKNADCNSATSAGIFTPARFWGGFSESGASLVTIPLSVLGADMSKLHAIEFRNFSPFGEGIQIDNIKLLQGCHSSVNVPTFKPTVCSLKLDDFDSDSSNSLSASVESSSGVSVTQGDGLISLTASSDTDMYSTNVFRDSIKLCSDLSAFDVLDVTYTGSGFSIQVSERDSDCSSDPEADTELKVSKSVTLPTISSPTTATVKFSDLGVDGSNIHGVVISGLGGKTTFDRIEFKQTECTGPGGSGGGGGGNSSGNTVAIIASAVCGGLVLLGLLAFCQRRRRVVRSPRAKGASRRVNQFRPSNPVSPGTPNLRSRPASARNKV